MPTKYAGATADINIIDGDIVNPIDAAVLKAILAGTPLLESILPAFSNNFSAVMDKYYDHDFSFGKPDSGAPITGQHPDVSVSNGTGGSSTEKFYPIAPIITEFRSLVDQNAAGNSTMYDESDALLRELGLTVATVDEALRGNASYGDIWAANIHLGVDLATQEPASILYLYEYYLNKYNTNNQSVAQYLSKRSHQSLPLDTTQNILTEFLPFTEEQRNAIYPYKEWIGEGLDDPSLYGYVENYNYEYYQRPGGPVEINRVQMTMYANIRKEVKAGVIGGINSVTSVFNKDKSTWSRYKQYGKPVRAVPANYNNPPEWGTASEFHVLTPADDKYLINSATIQNNIEIPEDYWLTIDGPHLVIRKQTSATHYTELTILKPFTGYRVMRANDKWQVSNDMTSAPVDRALLHNKLTPVQAAMALQDALMLHIEVADKYREARFYEKDAFGDILKIAGIAFTIFTWGTGAPLSGSLLAIAEEVALSLVVNYAIGELAALLAKHFGIVGAIVGVAVAYRYAGKVEGISFSGSLDGLPWANELLLAVDAVTKQIGEELTVGFAELAEDQEEFSALAEERTEELETAQALLNTETNYIDGFDLLNTSVRAMPVEIGAQEAPDQFYDRTIHSMNPGVLSLVAIQYYVSGALTLPSTHELTNYGSTGQRAGADGLLF